MALDYWTKNLNGEMGMANFSKEMDVNLADSIGRLSLSIKCQDSKNALNWSQCVKNILEAISICCSTGSHE